MQRQLSSHIANSQSHDELRVVVCDVPGPGGASRRYLIDAPRTMVHYLLEFQSGDPKLGINGLTNEALLAVVADRLQCFQQGPFPHPRNQLALEAVASALSHLHWRTAERREAGIEGQAIK